jgi:uncharacterized membrane protein
MKRRHRRRLAFYVAAIVGIAAWLVGRRVAPDLSLIIGADVFFLAYLVFVGVMLPRLTAAYLKRHADSADPPAWVSFAATLTIAAVAVVSLFVLINRQEAADSFTLGLTLASLPLGWLTIHTMAALHYAHLYWQPRSASSDTVRGGLQFPDTTDPGVLDFLYFSFIIGVAAQTADVTISSPHMRTTSLVHSLIAFAFNTVLVAAAVNVVVSLGN